jgi:hypothetical protein
VLRARLPLLLPFVLALLCACATVEQQTAAAVHGRILDDKFRPYKEFQTGEIHVTTPVGTGAKQLIARVDRKTARATYILVFHIAYPGNHRRTYSNARNDRAEALKVTPIARNSAGCRSTYGCNFDELVEIQIPEADLRQAPAAGYQLKLLPVLGPDALIVVAKHVIESLLAKVDGGREPG